MPAESSPMPAGPAVSNVQEPQPAAVQQEQVVARKASSMPPPINTDRIGQHSANELYDVKLLEAIKMRELSTPSSMLDSAGLDEEKLSAEHSWYLLSQHGTLDLEPMPDLSDKDPLNWPMRKKRIIFDLVVFQAFMATFTASSIIPSFEDIAQDLGVSLSQASYLTAIQIAALGVAPFFWRMAFDRCGRRHCLTASVVVSLLTNVGCALSNSYGLMLGMRFITASAISLAAACGSAIIHEIFFKRDRALYIGIWSMMVTLGVPVAPFVFGFVAESVSYRWIYWILAIVNFFQAILWLIFGAETQYVRDKKPAIVRAVSLDPPRQRRMDRTTQQAAALLRETFRPLFYLTDYRVLVSSVAYAMVFQFGSVLVTVEIPQLFVPKFELGPRQLGLQFIPLIIGSMLGEVLARMLSSCYGGRSGRRQRSERVLAPSHVGYVLGCVGLVVFLVAADRLVVYNVGPLVGAGIAAAGNQVVTSVLLNFAIAAHPEDAACVGIFVTFVRQLLASFAPYWLPELFGSIGLSATAGVCVALVVVGSVLPTVWMQVHGKKKNAAADMKADTESGAY